jgi:hypothetical protein
MRRRKRRLLSARAIVAIVSAVVAATVAPVVNSQAPTAAPGATPAARPAQGVTVTGRVQNRGGTARPAAQPGAVVLFADTGGPGLIGVPQRAIVQADGSFELTDIAPGAYRIAPDPNSAFQDQPLQVGPAGATGVIVPFIAPTEIRLSIKVDDGSPPPHSTEAPFAFMFGIGDTFMGGFVQHGERRLSAIPSDARIFLRPPSGYFLVTFRTADGHDLMDGRLTIPSGPARPMELQAVVSRTPPARSPTATVTGRLTGNHPDHEVALIDLAQIAPAPSRLGARTTAGADGAFAFNDVRPGVYDIDVPPATSVKRRVVVTGSAVADVLVEIPEGRVFAGSALGFTEENGTRQPRLPGRFTLRFRSATVDQTLTVRTQSFWSALPPGEYRVTVEDLPDGATLAGAQAGSVNLMSSPFRVPADRNPEVLRVLLRLTRDDGVRLGPVVPRPAGSSAPNPR